MWQLKALPLNFHVRVALRLRSALDKGNDNRALAAVERDLDRANDDLVLA